MRAGCSSKVEDVLRWRYPTPRAIQINIKLKDLREKGFVRVSKQETWKTAIFEK